MTAEEVLASQGASSIHRIHNLVGIMGRSMIVLRHHGVTSRYHRRNNRFVLQVAADEAAQVSLNIDTTGVHFGLTLRHPLFSSIVLHDRLLELIEMFLVENVLQLLTARIDCLARDTILIALPSARLRRAKTRTRTEAAARSIADCIELTELLEIRSIRVHRSLAE